jgi:adenylate cyclase class IV
MADRIFFIHIHIKLIRLSQYSHATVIYYGSNIDKENKKSRPKSQMQRGMKKGMHTLFKKMTLPRKAAVIRLFYKRCKSP